MSRDRASSLSLTIMRVRIIAMDHWQWHPRENGFPSNATIHGIYRRRRVRVSAFPSFDRRANRFRAASKTEFSGHSMEEKIRDIPREHGGRINQFGDSPKLPYKLRRTYFWERRNIRAHAHLRLDVLFPLFPYLPSPTWLCANRAGIPRGKYTSIMRGNLTVRGRKFPPRAQSSRREHPRHGRSPGRRRISQLSNFTDGGKEQRVDISRARHSIAPRRTRDRRLSRARARARTIPRTLHES